MGKSSGPDGVSPEHIKYGGESLKVWLKKVFNRILFLEEVPASMKDGLVIPVYKGQGKDPLLLNSYRGITLSSVVAKLLEIVLLQRLSPVLEDLGVPDSLQTAYQKGISCMDAIYATQEALMTHLQDGGHPYLCLFDIEKAFDSVEFPILLQNLYDIGINGKCWRLIKNWYEHSISRVRVCNQLSAHFNVERGVKQGSVLSPTLFLIVMDSLLKQMKANNCGLSVCGTYAGAAIHADDLRTAAASKDAIDKQVDIIRNFTENACLKLNTSKLEVLKISHQFSGPETLHIGDLPISTTPAAKCLGVWWQHNLSASRAVQENISKARRAFFALGSLGAFQGDLNPLSSRSIFETSVIPILLYGCETWLLDSSSSSKLEKFQSEIGRRILHLPKNHSGKVVRLGLHWPSMSTRILIRKLTFLAKLLTTPNDSISKRIFSSLAIVDIYSSSIVQQCRMLESTLGTHILAQCLQHPQEAASIVRSGKTSILKQDFNLLLSSSFTHPTASLVASVAQTTSWCRLIFRN